MSFLCETFFSFLWNRNEYNENDPALHSGIFWTLKGATKILAIYSAGSLYGILKNHQNWSKIFIFGEPEISDVF